MKPLKTVPISCQMLLKKFVAKSLKAKPKRWIMIDCKSISMTKSELRKIYLAKQTSLLREERTRKSQKIADRFFETFNLSEIDLLHCFIAIEKFNEIDTTLIFRRLWEEFPHITTVVPRVDFKTGEMQNLKFTSDTELVENVWKIHEPSHDEFIETDKLDMILVPLLCFDNVGHRVGHGKGFYDKFLSRCRRDCIKVGLSYFEPVEEISDVNELDVKLDFCVTPDEILTIQE